MSENLNWLNNIRKAFDGFEPDVKGNWNSINRELDLLSNGQTHQLNLLRRMKMAKRVAIGATAVATSMTIWVATSVDTSFNATDQSEALATVVSNPLESQVDLDGGIVEGAAGKFQFDATHHGFLKGQSFVLDYREKQASMAADGAESQVIGPKNSIVFSLPNGESSDSHGDVTANGSIKANTDNSNDGIVESEIRSSELAEGRIPQSRKNRRELASDESSESERNNSVVDEHTSGESSRSASAVSINASVQEACAGTEVSFVLDGADENTSVLWNFGDGGFSQETAPSYIYEKPGTFDITVSVRVRGEGTIRTRTVENMIVVRPKPEANMRWELRDCNAEEARIKLIDDTFNASSSVWMVEQRNTNASEVKLDIPGEYPVNLVASNAFGCQDIASEFVVLGSRKEAIAPALFSPNGDGRYDTFIPFIVMDFEGSWELTIWDDGEKIFSSKSSMNPWDGSFTNGSRAKVGKKYTWKLETRGLNGEVEYFIDEVLIDG